MCYLLLIVNKRETFCVSLYLCTGSILGIMAVLFAGIVMSHYTHRNLSPITQITVQQTFRTVAFMAETCVFAYLGMSIFSMYHHVKVSFVLWAIVSILCIYISNN